MRTNHTRLAAAAVALCATTLLAACGDDDETADTAAPAADTTEAPAATTEAPAATTEAPAATTEAPAATTEAPAATTAAPAEGGTASAAFCESFVALDRAFANAPEDPAKLEKFIAEEVTPNVETIKANLPDEVAEEVTTMVTAVETVASTGDFSAFDTPEFSQAQAVAYPFLEDGCGLPAVHALARDFTYGGVPAELEAGTTVFLLTNDSESGEMHEMGIVKLKDGDDISLEELLALPEAKADKHIESFAGVFAMPDTTSGTTVELTPGRWVYACFIPVGSVNGKEGKGVPHFMEGMSGEFVVT